MHKRIKETKRVKRRFCKLFFSFLKVRYLREHFEVFIRLLPQKLEINIMEALYELAPDGYEKYVVPQRFLNPAKDTAQLVKQHMNASDKRLVDLGTGNGIVLSQIKALDLGMTLFGLDNSGEMLEMAQKNGADVVLKSSLPGIPLISNYVDVITSNFVLSHIPNYEMVLAEVGRVLRKGGKFIFTAWTGGQKHYNKIFYDTVTQFISEEAHAKIMRDFLPNEDFLEDQENLKKVLASHQLNLIECTQRKYQVPLNLEDYLNCRLHLLISKYMKQMLPEATWKQYTDSLYEAFHQEVGDSITYEGTVDFYVCEAV